MSIARNQKESIKMWAARKLLLATMVFTAVFYRLAAQETKLLDSAPNAVDYLYDECSEEAKRNLTDSDVIKKELNLNEKFKTAWEKIYNCAQQKPGDKKEQITALLTYVEADQDFQNTFNDEVETKGVDVTTYENNFNFKSLHFLLMSFMEMHQNNCMTMYAYTERYQFDAKNGSEVRLGRFMMAKESIAEVRSLFQEESNAVILNITSCFFVSLRNKTCIKDKMENALLLSPAEVFSVEDKIDVHDADNGDFTMIILKHSSLTGRQACHSPSKSHGLIVSSQWLELVLVALSLFFLNC